MLSDADRLPFPPSPFSFAVPIQRVEEPVQPSRSWPPYDSVPQLLPVRLFSILSFWFDTVPHVIGSYIL